MENKKQYIYLSAYIIIFVLIPYFVRLFIQDNLLSFDLFGYLSFYLLFISPLIFFIFYKLADLRDRKSKTIFIVIGLIIPFTLIYLNAYSDFLQNFHPGF